MRRAVSVFLTVLAVLCLVVALTEFQVADCSWSAVEQSRKAKGDPLPSSVQAIALQIHGGDKEWGKAVRAAAEAHIREKYPAVQSVVDGPPPKGALLLKLSLVSGDVTWSPVWARAEVGVQGVLRASPRQDLVVEGRVRGTCSGLVSRPLFLAELGPRSGAWLNDFLDSAFSASPNNLRPSSEP